MEYVLIIGYKKKRYTIEIPNEIDFFSDGKGYELYKTYYYNTILKTKDYKNWIKYLKNLKCDEIKLVEFDIYTFIEFQDVSSETLIPVIDKNEFLKKNNINLWNYTFVLYNENKNIIQCLRITDFKILDDVICAKASRKSLILDSKYVFSISTENRYRFEEVIYGGFRHEVKVLKNEEADIMWNTIMWETLSKVNLDLSKINENLKLDNENKNSINIF